MDRKINLWIEACFLTKPQTVIMQEGSLWEQEKLIVLKFRQPDLLAFRQWVIHRKDGNHPVRRPLKTVVFLAGRRRSYGKNQFISHMKRLVQIDRAAKLSR